MRLTEVPPSIAGNSAGPIAAEWRFFAGTACLAVAMLFASCSVSPAAAKRNALQKGDRFLQEGKYADAAIQYRKAIQADANSGDAYLGIGRLEEKQNHLWPAFNALTQALTLMPDSSEAKIELADVALRLYLGDPHKPRGLYDRVTDLADQLLAKTNDSFEAFRLKGYLALSNGNLANTISYFQRADSIRPDQPDVVMLLVQNLFQDGQAEAAEARAVSFLQRNKTYAPIYDQLYSYYSKTGQSAKAEDLLKDKVNANPKNGLFITQLAEHYWRTNRRQDATQWIATLIGRFPDIPDAYFQAGDFYVRVQSWDDALKQFEAGMKASPKESVSYQERIANALMLQGKPAEAGQALDRLVKDHPEDRSALAARAALFAASGRPEDLDRAIAGFKALLAKDPSNIDYQMPLAVAYRTKGDTASAKTQFLAIVRTHDSYVPAWQALAELAVHDQQCADATRYANRVLELDAVNASARLVRTACMAVDGNYPDAESALAELIRDQPQLKEARMQMALLRLEQKRYKDAEALFLKYYRPGEADVRLLKGLVAVYHAENQPDKALRLLLEEQRRSPQSLEVRDLLASVATDAGKLDLALEQYRVLAQASPNSVDIPMQMALIYQAKGDTDQAIESYEVARRLAPQNPLPPALLGRLYDQAGKKAEAIAAYRISLRLQPDNASVLNNLAYLLAESGGSLDEALKFGQQALEREPTNAGFTDTVAWIYYKRGDTASALPLLQALTKREPANATFRLHLATVILAAGNVASAQKELNKALELHPSHEEEAQIRQMLAKAKEPALRR